ncbi:MAG: hypothetical protein Q8S73_36810 [Deltaproteobacteria bacterium]|nr:hypothetical protein [Myxococcales bacterium]MDP3219721.1 hypothetical protein [Deltaproteobacteria bacterium]
MIGSHIGESCYRLTHRATGVVAAVWWLPARGSKGVPPAEVVDRAKRLLRHRLRMHFAALGPLPLVRTVDLIDGADAARALLEGGLPMGGAR